MDKQGHDWSDIENHPDYVRSASNGKQMTYDPWMGFDGEAESLTQVKVESIPRGVHILPQAESHAEPHAISQATSQASNQAMPQSKSQERLKARPQAVPQTKSAAQSHYIPQPDHARQGASNPQHGNAQISGPATSYIQDLYEGLGSETTSSRIISVEPNPAGSNRGIFEFVQNTMGRHAMPAAPPHNRQPEPEFMIIAEDDAGGVQPDASPPSDQGSLPDFPPESDDDSQPGCTSPVESQSRNHYEQLMRQRPAYQARTYIPQPVHVPQPHQVPAQSGHPHAEHIQEQRIHKTYNDETDIPPPTFRVEPVTPDPNWLSDDRFDAGRNSIEVIRNLPTMPPPRTLPRLAPAGTVHDDAEDVDERFCAQCGTYLGVAQTPKGTDAIYWQGRDLRPVYQGDAEMCAHCKANYMRARPWQYRRRAARPGEAE